MKVGRVLVIGNYANDRQESMQRFAVLLSHELSRRGYEIERIEPRVIFGRLHRSPTGIGKWLGYLDKFVLFPWTLRMRVHRIRRQANQPSQTRWMAHICDHSNAYYAFISGVQTVVTCHDLLAVRGALGEETYCPASWSGRLLQRLILRGLMSADYVVCDSEATRSDLVRLAGAEMADRSSVALLAQNHAYQQLPREEAKRRLDAITELDQDHPFVLAVGSGLRRKNRDGVLRIIARLGTAWKGQVVFAGEALDGPTVALATELGIAHRVVQVTGPSNDILEALYNRAFALLYPSRCEGFGWPLIEAQACGCPVVCSDQTSVPEIAGDGAIVCSLEDEASFADALLSLRDMEARARLTEKGFKNLARFTLDKMLAGYTSAYARVMDSAPHRS